jgi:hypothetical protein
VTGKDYKPRSKRVCYRYGKSGHFIAKCPYTSESDRDDDKKGKGKKKMEKKRHYKKKGGETHIGRDWDSDESSTDYSSDESSTDYSSDEDAAIIAVNKGLLFPNVGHKCLMDKDGKKKKVHSRSTPKYTTSSDEGSSSDNEDDLISLCWRSETGGSLGPTSECRRVPQPRWVEREGEREGGRSEAAVDRRERGGNPAAFVFVPRPGRVRLQ